ncbi:repressor LexA [Lysobacter oculi]|uniref:LexA repressor n=1 Tax=Solilutibacter oculi TaxID=2698682 RepID=A0A344J381_9GAMM|nr:transcriptional repressor LexA [Lysobacter oculi]AXA83491.1 repressor LexA [Lysobacter oculi]
MTIHLTPRQQAVLDFIQRHQREEGLPPTLQQIADAFGFAQACAAHKHVKRLQEAGHLQVLPGQARGIRLPTLRKRRRSDEETMVLPVLGRVAAGIPIGADAGVHRELRLDPALFSLRPDYLLRVKGDSMLDEGILDGDLVAVKRSADARNGQVVVARIEGELTIKRLELGRDALRLLPRNAAHAPIDIPAGSDFAIEGVYCGLVRDA